MRYTIDNLPIDTKTDWERFHAIRDEDIDTSDIPELGEEFWKHAVMVPPLIGNKQAISLRIDPDILAWFKKQGGRYQSRINAVLRAYMQSHRR